MVRKSFAIAVALIATYATPLLLGQAAPTAVRKYDVQVGAQVSLANPGIPADASIDYGKWDYKGAGAYATIDPSTRFGIELNARDITGTYVSEATYEIGPRFHRTFGRFAPYGKALYGRGVFTFPGNLGSLGFNELVFGGGLDYRLSPILRVRIDYEHQDWLGFSTSVPGFPGSLTPEVVSLGVAYHFR